MNKKRSEYSLLGKVFNKGLTDDERNENFGVLKRLDKIDRTNWRILGMFDDNRNNGGNAPKKPKRPKKQEDKKQDEKDYGLNYDLRYNFNTFDKEFKRASSVESKRDVFKNFEKKLNEFIKQHKAQKDNSKIKKASVVNNAKKLPEQMSEFFKESTNTSSRSNAKDMIDNITNIDDKAFILYNTENGQDKLEASAVKNLLKMYERSKDVSMYLEGFKSILDNAKQVK